MKRAVRSIIIAAVTFCLTSQPGLAFAQTASAAGSSNNSLEFGSASSYLSLSPGINVGTSAFTFETYFKTGPVIDNGFFLGVGSGNGISINIHSATEIQIDGYGISATIFVLPSAMQVNTWHHLAVTRDASKAETVWLDGARATSSYNRWGHNSQTGAIYIDNINYNGNATGINISTACGHCNQPGDRDFNGLKLTNFRVVVGSALYDPSSPTITLPATPLTNVTNTKLLLNVVSNASAVTDSSGTQTVTNTSAVFTAADISAPAAPTSLSAAAGNTEATIGFTAGANGGSEITNYKYSLDGSTFTALSPAATTSPVTIPGLTNGTTHSIYLKAVNVAGDSPASSPVTVTPVAPVVTSAAASPVVAAPVVITTVTTKNVAGKKVVNWNTDTDLLLTTYNKTTKKTSTRTITDQQALVSNPKPGQSVRYTVTSSTGQVLKAFTIKTKPGIPKMVTTQIQATTLTASWMEATGASKYRVTITPKFGKPIVLITTDPNISIDLENSAAATIKIVAIGANGLTSQVISKTI